MIDFDLNKKGEAFVFQLEKKGITKVPTMRVYAALDVSGSMDDEIRDGSLSKTLDQFGGIAIKLDDNGEIDVVAFDDRYYPKPTWKPADFRTYVRRNIDSMGGTAYSPFINHIVRECFGAQPTMVPTQVEKKGFLGFGKKTETVMVPADPSTGVKHQPVLVLVVTDGEPLADSYDRIKLALQNAGAFPIFFAFIGMSNQHVSFPTLKQLDREFTNVGVIEMKFGRPDEEMYDKLITPKLIDFFNQH